MKSLHLETLTESGKELFPKLARVEKDFAKNTLTPMIASSRELTVMVSGVKCTFAHYPFRLLQPFSIEVPLQIMSTEELLATKAYTIGRRGSLKDYVDLWAGIEAGAATLPEIVALADKKYEDAFNDRLFLEQLLYLDDVADEALIMSGGRVQPSKKDIIDFFYGHIRDMPI